MTRELSIRWLALFVALALPAGAAAQASPARKPTPAAPTVQQGAPSPEQKAGAQRPAAPGAAKPAQPEAAKRANAKPAQPPVPAAAPAAARPAAKPGSQVAVPVFDAYSYRAEGRRDPFVSLLTRGTDPRTRKKVEGLAGMMAGDMVLKGILQSRGSYLAIVQGPDSKRQLIVRPNDRFADGVVKAITADTVVILQEVNDPLSLTKQREIRKTLRAVEEVK